jgi:hypothetical protein
MNFRMLPPVAVSPQTIVANGRAYSAAPGAALDVPDFDAAVLAANSWAKVALSGPTSARPAPNTTTLPYIAGIGTLFFDVTLGKLVAFDGATWRDPATGNAA